MERIALTQQESGRRKGKGQRQSLGETPDVRTGRGRGAREWLGGNKPDVSH